MFLIIHSTYYNYNDKINGGVMTSKKSTRKSTTTGSTATKKASSSTSSTSNSTNTTVEMEKMKADLLLLTKKVEALEADRSLLLKFQALEASLEDSMKKFGETFKDRLSSLKNEDSGGKDKELRAILSRTNIHLKKLLR